MKTVLIADDDPLFVEVLSKALQQASFLVLTADRSTTALDILASREDIDLLIADIRMPSGEPHGITLARMARNRRHSLPIIVVTVHRPYRDVEDSFGRIILKEEGIQAIVDEVARRLEPGPVRET
jgi:CheY-like chemotaxis protein